MGYYVYQREAIFARVAGKTLDIVAGREDGLICNDLCQEQIHKDHHMLLSCI